MPAKPAPWQIWHPGNPFAAFAAIPWGWAAGATATHPAGWPAAAPWQSVLLKQPGAVPAGAAGLGGAIGEFAPFEWQKAQTGAFPAAVLVWT